jgi:protein gp37
VPTAIEWTEETFNPWWGCVRVSPACAHCYADTFSRRLGMSLWEEGGSRRFFGDRHWEEPLRWNRRGEKRGRRVLVFCASMADVFEDHPSLEEHRERLWDLIEATPWLTWQLLTKRPENIGLMFPWLDAPPNVWLGTSIENARYTYRADQVQEVNAPVHFLSCEPLLGSLFRSDGKRRSLDLDGIEWVIGGGESGAQHRPFDIAWAREIRDACEERGIPFFWKQNGGLRPKAGGKELDGREHCEIPREQVAA